jgi:hypothetical protein
VCLRTVAAAAALLGREKRSVLLRLLLAHGGVETVSE